MRMDRSGVKLSGVNKGSLGVEGNKCFVHSLKSWLEMA